MSVESYYVIFSTKKILCQIDFDHFQHFCFNYFHIKYPKEKFICTDFISVLDPNAKIDSPA